MQANFNGGPLDGISREVDIAFAIIEIFWAEGGDPETIELFRAYSDATEVWQYELVETDYETYAVYNGNVVGRQNVVEVEPDVWTAAGRHFDVLNEDDYGSVTVQIDGDEIHFPGLFLTVRLAQRQGE